MRLSQTSFLRIQARPIASHAINQTLKLYTVVNYGMHSAFVIGKTDSMVMVNFVLKKMNLDCRDLWENARNELVKSTTSTVF